MRRLQSSIFVSVLLLLALGPARCPAPPAAQTRTIVVDVWLQSPVYGAPEVKAGPGLDVNLSDITKAVTDANGNVVVQAPPSVARTTVSAGAPGYGLWEQSVDVADGLHVTVHLQLVDQPTPHVQPPAWRADGRVFRQGDAIVRWKGLTAFTLFKRWLDGEEIGPFLRWARSERIDANLVRVLCRVQWGRLNPKTVPEYFSRLDTFIQVLEDAGLRAELVALADCRTTDGAHQVSAEYSLTDEEMVTFAGQVAAVAARHASAVFEVGNEWPFNGWDPAAFPARFPFPALLQSRGSAGEDGAPPRPAWDFGTFHAGRAGEWARKQGKQAAEWSWGAGASPAGGPLWVPVVDDEPQRITPSSAPAEFYAAHAVSSLFAAGSTIHSDALKLADIPTGDELKAVEAAAQAWREVPLDAPLGTYTRGPLAECPLEHVDLDQDADRGALRTFCQVAGASATCVVVTPGPRYQAVARGGWRIVERRGPAGQVVRLER
jgi:hypothetical protein